MAKKQYYEILGVNKNSSKEEIKRAYRNLAKKYHPDTNKTTDTDQEFKKIKEAYEILSDPHKKNKSIRYCSYCGEVVENPEFNERKGTSNKNAVLSIIIVLQVISILVLAYFYIGSFSNKAETRAEELLRQIEGLQEEAENYKQKADLLTEVSSFINAVDAGRASKSFYASEKVIILSKSAAQTKAFSVTVELPRPYTLEWDYDGSIIEITSANSWKEVELTIFVKPLRLGKNYITFSNTRNAQKFRVLVIVTE